MSLHADIVDGLAADLAAAGLASWSPDGNYPAAPALPPVYAYAWPSTIPAGLAVTLTPYVVGDDTGQAMSTVGVQVRLRGPDAARRALLNLQEAILSRWHSRGRTTLPSGVTMAQSNRRSSTGPGRDGQSLVILDSYWLDVDHPTDHRT